MSELRSLGAPLNSFSYMLVCQCAAKPSINELLAVLWIAPSLPWCWVRSCPPWQGAVGLVLYSTVCSGRQMLSKNEDKVILFISFSPLRGQRVPPAFFSQRGGPGHTAIAQLNHICCLTAPSSACNTCQEMVQKITIETSQHRATRETVSLCHGHQRAIQNYPTHL